MKELMQVISYRRTLLLLVCLLFIAVPVVGQTETVPVTVPAHGPVIEGNRLGGSSETLNPLYCQDAACRRITSLLFPTLVAVDPTTGQFMPDLTNALAADWTISTDGTDYTFTLREGVTWSDGEPVTAYDVFFSYLAMVDDRSPSPYRSALLDTALIPVDAKTVAVHFDDPGCDAALTLARAVFPVIPVHRYDAGFADKAARFFTGQTGSTGDLYAAWLVDNPEDTRYSYVRFAPDSGQPGVTFGNFRFQPGREDDAGSYRLYRADASVIPDAYVLMDTSSEDDTVDRFINGEINYIENPPVNRRDDLRAVPGIQITQLAGTQVSYIGFNLADPNRPDKEDTPLGNHPLFADSRVREAVRLALDVPVIIDTVMQGDGQVAAAPYQPETTDVRAAEKLLESAGWKDTNGDGLRQCIDCPYGKAGDTLSFSLIVENSQPAQLDNAGMIRRQLEAVGFSVNTTTVSDAAELQHNLEPLRFDAFLTTLDLYAPHSRQPNCQLPASESRELSVNGFPVVWLYVPDEFYAAGPGVQGFAPYLDAPLWNVTSWSITK